jgi:signal transduction histidine kinase
VVQHAGAGARAYVLLEDLGDDVIVSVRDDGAGIAPGRLAEAEAEGHMGISKSILGRVRVLGGTAELDTEPGQGTEWEIRVPKGEDRDG